ncbi:hypothetical protein KCU64_g14163, partial [Aureobasidium melanogenum]
MSGRLLSSRYATLARHSSPLALRSPYHTAQQRAGGLITRNSIPRSRPLSSGPNTPVVRHASFARAIPKLAFKLIRLPAILGATAVGSLAYIQYQAAQAGNYAIDLFTKASDATTTGARSIFEGAGGIFAQTKAGWEKTKKDLQELFPQQESSGPGGDGG